MHGGFLDSPVYMAVFECLNKTGVAPLNLLEAALVGGG